MARKKESVKVNEFEEKEGTGKVGKILGSVALYGAMLILGYIVCATPETGTGMAQTRSPPIGLSPCS